MTTNIGRMHALKTLTALQEPGGFTLPADLANAVAAVGQVDAIPLPDLPVYDIEQAASDVLADLAGGRTSDLAGYADKLSDVITAGTRRERAQTLVRIAHEQAVSSAVNTAADLADWIITTVLRPAFAHVLERTEQLAATLHGHPLDYRSLLDAPPKIRAAQRDLQTVADRYRGLRQARNLTNIAGLRAVQHDARGEFADLSDPHVLSGYQAGNTTGQPPRIDYPTDQAELMLWLVGAGKPAKPWLPTVDEQDERWQAAYGEAQRRRQVAALSARAYAGQQV